MVDIFNTQDAESLCFSWFFRPADKAFGGEENRKTMECTPWFLETGAEQVNYNVVKKATMYISYY